MMSFAQALDLKDDPDLIRAYREHHRAVWPEVVAGLRAIGITRMKLFLLGTRLFMYFEAPDGFDPARDYQSYASDPRCAAWDALMRRFQQPAPGAKAGDWWTPMEPVFDLELA
jgi:L-rhamnose mutarotase